jgi:hypothetical protein
MSQVGTNVSNLVALANFQDRYDGREIYYPSQSRLHDILGVVYM